MYQTVALRCKVVQQMLRIGSEGCTKSKEQQSLKTPSKPPHTTPDPNPKHFLLYPTLGPPEDTNPQPPQPNTTSFRSPFLPSPPPKTDTNPGVRKAATRSTPTPQQLRLLSPLRKLLQGESEGFRGYSRSPRVENPIASVLKSNV